MGELILCQHPIAANPYYIDTLSLNIYSLEELSYYIYHNVDLMEEEFFGEDLIHWIREEVGDISLADNLERLWKEGASLQLLTGKVLASNAYLTQVEIKETVAAVSEYAGLSKSARKKKRADALMQKGRLTDAIYAYEDLLLDDKTPRLLMGDIYHNIGSAYARLFFFREAAEYFESAYQKNNRTTSLMSMFYALWCDGNEEGFKEKVIEYHLPHGNAESVKKIYSAAVHSDEVRNFQESLLHLQQEGDKVEAFEKALNSIVSDWKRDYNRLCRV